MRLIPLSQGHHAIIDDEDFENVNRHKWYLAHSYAVRRVTNHNWKVLGLPKQRELSMHRFLMNPPSGKHVDHINGDALDNRRCNLRICTPHQNSMNIRIKNGRYKGVSWNCLSKKWQATIKFNNKGYHLGHYADPVEAAKAYNAKAKEFFGPFACLNTF